MSTQPHFQSPRVSVLLLTYNHERFIEAAIESALRQETTFDYEIVIGEDCSTDSTRQIVCEWQHRYPGIIRCLLPFRNLGIHRNFVQTLQACTGQYIAVMDGDDFWTSPEKLQKQSDFLDHHPDYAICFHNVTVFQDGAEDGSALYCAADQKQTSTLEDVLRENFIPTCSVMVRNGLVREVPDWIYSLKMLDWPLFMLNAQHGYIGYLNEVMGAYRLHSNGVYSRLGPIEQQLVKLEMYEAIRGQFGSRRDKLIKDRIFEICRDLANRYAELDDLANAKKYARMCFARKPLTSFTNNTRKIMKVRTPRLFSLAHELNKRSQSAREKLRAVPDSETNTVI